MRKVAYILLVALGAIIVSSGTLVALREAAIVTISLKVLAPVFVVFLGLWIIACAIECRNNTYQKI